MTLPLASKTVRTFTPRPYQTTARQRVREAWERGESPLLVMATGTGKTATALHIAEQEPGRVVWLAHREELLTQPYDALWFDRHAAGIVQADRDAPDSRIVFASVGTLLNQVRLEAVLRSGHPDLLVVDEAHHSVSPSHRTVIDALRGPKTRMLGLTATADREDDRDLGELWTVAFSLGIVEAIAGNFLLPPFSAVVRLKEFDPSKVSGRRDYDDAELGEALLAAHVVEHTVDVMSRSHDAIRLPRREGEDETRELQARGRSTLVFTATVEQAELTAEALEAAGWKARAISGETPAGDRRRLLRAFQRGEIDVLCNAAVLTEGTDLPRCSCVVLARPTRSWSLFVQMLGRGLRLWDGDGGAQTECLVLDLAGATEDHSLIAAPALIGGTRCKGAKSPNGQHLFVSGAEGKAECKFCDTRLSCWLSLQAGYAGQHVWNDGGGPLPKDAPPPEGELANRFCVHCKRAQCLDAPDGRHYPIPQPGWQRMCLHCEATFPVPLASMQEGRGPTGDAPKAAWVALHQLDRAIEVLDLGEHGFLFLPAPTPTTAHPIWLPPRARNPRPLTEAPVERWYALDIAADLIRKARKAWDPWRRETLFGGVDGSVGDVVDLRRRATARAVATGIASWR